MVLLPKGGGEFRRIGLVEVICKLCDSTMKNSLRYSIILHDVLYGFRQGMGMGMGMGKGTLEGKLEQQFAGICHDPLLQVFLDVLNSYNSLERGRCMEILNGNDPGPKI